MAYLSLFKKSKVKVVIFSKKKKKKTTQIFWWSPIIVMTTNFGDMECIKMNEKTTGYMQIPKPQGPIYKFYTPYGVYTKNSQDFYEKNSFNNYLWYFYSQLPQIKMLVCVQRRCL